MKSPHLTSADAAIRATGATPDPSSGRRRGGSGRLLLVVLASAAALFGLFVLSLALGSRTIPFSHTLSVLLRPDGGAEALVIWHLRMPRALAAVVVGVGLSAAGLVMQALTRNPLAEPGILGVNAGASVAVVLGVVLAGAHDAAGYVWWALAGAAAAAAVVFLLGRGGTGPASSSGTATGGSSRLHIVLAGTALGASLGSVTGIITMVDSAAFDAHRFWVVGSLAGRDMATVEATAPFVLVGAVMTLILCGPLNVLLLGEDSAAALGVRVGPVRVLALAAITLLAGGSTALAGPVAFVGLVVPHVLRLLLGPDLRRLMPLALVAGPCLVLASDIVGRVVAAPAEIAVGVVTAFLGAPTLLWLVVRGRS